MTDCSSIGARNARTCAWTFDDQCNLINCAYSALPQDKVFYNWNDCSVNCCSLNTYTRQGVQECVNSYNLKIGVGLGVGFGYPLIAIFIWLFGFKRNCQFICLSLFWFLIPFYWCYQCRRQRQSSQATKQNQAVQETRNQRILRQQNSQIKAQLKNIRELISTNQLNRIKENQKRQSENCIICRQRKRQVVGECGHYCVCKQCSIDLNKCPMCRTKTNWKKVYVS